MHRVTVAMLADIHGNYLALQACLEYAKARRAEKYLFLGDYITDFPYPQRTLEQLYEMDRAFDCRFVRGNREEYMIAYRENGGKQEDGTPWRDCSAQGALLYCYENLTDRDIDWFENLPVSGAWEIEGAPPIAYCHGSPASTRASMARTPAVLEEMAAVPEKFLVTGHTHRTRDLWYRGTRIVCAGSVGNAIGATCQPGKPAENECAKSAQMVLLHLEREGWRPEFVRVPYDWQGAVKTLESAGLHRRAPVWAAMLRHTARTGEDACGMVPRCAAELYARETGKAVGWPQVPEEYWRRAAEIFGVELY